MIGHLGVSIALCTHNGARFVEEQVRSILKQSELPVQVVLSDDASTDDTVALVEGLWADLDPTGAPELVVLRNEAALGVVRNFQQAVEACNSELIALSDQDDVWAPNRLEAMSSRFELDPTLELLFSNATLIDAEGRPTGSLFEALEIDRQDLADIRLGDAFGVLLRRNVVTGATAVFRRELVERAIPFPPTWVHDEWLAIIAAATSRIDWMPDRLIGYRQHGSNQIGVAAPTLRYKVARVLQARGDRYTGMVDHSQVLLDRLRRLGVGDELIALTEAKVAHDRFRAGLPANRLARIAPVLRSASTGAYARFCSRKRLDILRDLLQPGTSLEA
ncbi:MAG: glycosyl transferase family 2 [Rhodoglobus sp.]|nr:glycosyl transferase family 2 [Rhodoglobus sp.]